MKTLHIIIIIITIYNTILHFKTKTISIHFHLPLSDGTVPITSSTCEYFIFSLH